MRHTTSAIRLVVGLVLVGCLTPAGARADLIAPEDFTLYATHPDAVQQATERGQTIRDVLHYNGQLYLGYGDWAYDDGPIQIRGLDAGNGTWSGSYLSFATEAVSHFRILGGQVVATSTDPSGIGIQPGGYATGNVLHQWTSNSSVPATHVFDINQTANGDVWLVGSLDATGTVWRSTDGGASFSIARQDVPPPEAPWFAFSRYVGAGVYNGNLIVQRVDINTSIHHAQSLIFDGVNWVEGPDLLSQGSGFMTKPQQFGNYLVYMDNDLSLGQLYRFDGSTSEFALNRAIHDFQVTDGQVIALAEGGELLHSSDLVTWSSAGFAPLDARSLELVGNQLFVGTTQAQVFRTFQLGGLSVVPEPSGALLWVGLGGLWLMRRRRREV